jgi:hypothetical protein
MAKAEAYKRGRSIIDSGFEKIDYRPLGFQGLRSYPERSIGNIFSPAPNSPLVYKLE